MQRRGRLRVFAYVDADKAELYRVVMGAFMKAKERFALHLRPEEVSAQLVVTEDPVALEEVDTCLRQLATWGNLVSSPDTADVVTVEDFYRDRRLYQLSREGEAAEAALRVYEEAVRQPGELQAAALADIRELLLELEQLVVAESADESKAAKVLGELFRLFEELTEKAQVFLGGLRRSIELHGAEEEVFLQYKERLIDYLQRFVDELIVASAQIARSTERVEAAGVVPFLDAAARREIRDRPDADEVEAEAVARWRSRWDGLRGWFHGTPGQPSQAEVLRARARAAIPALLTAVEAIHDRRIRRADRQADWRTLARWFAETPSDEHAHRLYRAAFAMSPARHLRINAESLEAMDGRMEEPRTSWLDEPTLRIAPRLRAKGRYARPGRERKIEDRSEARRRLAELAEAEARELEQARAQLVRGRVRLSELGPLDPAAFGLFLELVAQGLSQQARPGAAVETLSADGALLVRLEPTGDGRAATVTTAHGALTGPDHWIEVLAARTTRAAEAAE